MFWKAVKPSSTDKIITNEQITMVENDEDISDNDKIAETMNYFFSNVVNLLDIPENNDLVKNSENIKDPVAKAINKCSIHPSIIKIKEMKTKRNKFNICHTSVEHIMEIILDLDVNKATSKDGIPAKLIEENYDIFSAFLCKNFNNGVDHVSSNTLKLAEIKTTFYKR